MFHGKHLEEALERAGGRAGLEITAEEIERFSGYAEWLVSEGFEAGGIGPAERERLTDRHLADSLVFAAAWEGAPGNLLDAGSGVGLPGIPLAITHPETEVTLLDRSAGRCRLARRAVRVVGLTNVAVERGDVARMGRSRVSAGWDVVTFRASLPPGRALAAALPLLAPGGVAVVGLSRRTAPTEIPEGPNRDAARVDLVEIEAGVLDSPAWLLRMTRVAPRK